MTIRPAVISDVPWLLDEVRAFGEFYGGIYSIPVVGNDAHVASKLQWLIEEHVFLVAEHTNWAGGHRQEVHRVGFIAGILDGHVWNPEITVLTQLFWWVIPSSRNTTAGLRLVDAFIEIGKDKADWVTFGLTTKTNVKADAILKRGFQEVEKTFLMEVP